MGVQPQSVPALNIPNIPRTVPLEITTPRGQFDLLRQNLRKLRQRYEKLEARPSARLKPGGASQHDLLLPELPSGVTLVDPSDSSQTQTEDQVQNKYIIACINYLDQQVEWLKHYRESQKSLEDEQIYCARISNYIILQQYVNNDFIDEFLEVQQRQFGHQITADHVEEQFLRLLRGEAQLLSARNNSSRDQLFL